MNRWNLKGISFEEYKFFYEYDFLVRKLQDIEDPYKAASFVPKQERDIFIIFNIEKLVASGKLEKIMINFYTMVNFPMTSFDIERWRYMFDHCNRSRLLAEGDELPKELGSEFTIYRGQNLEEVPGISWTLSKEKADWFAKRNEMFLGGKGKTDVVDMRVTLDDILYYYNGREEQEVVVSPHKLYGDRI